MIDRTEFANELILRENVRKAIKIVKRRRKNKILAEQSQEEELRIVIRELIGEAQSAVSTAAIHDNSGLNALEDLFKNTNLLSVFERGYKALTSKKQQRDSYLAHWLSGLKKMLAPEEERKEADQKLDAVKGNERGSIDLSEDIDIGISDNPKDDPAFIDIEEPEEKSEEEKEKEEITVPGLDKTGRNKAYTDLKNVEKTTLKIFDGLDDIDDRDPFEEYLLKNLFLYADVYENDLDDEPEIPAGVESAEVNVPQLEDPAPEEEIANIELQEVIKHLNLDDIIKNLL
tara:strand:+ start:2448 stop:3308 length:861 start_codon:yes stop_codon:yes gene_type:complete